MKIEKEKFLKNTFWILSVQDAFKTRNSKYPVYVNGLTEDDKRKRDLKLFLRDGAENLINDLNQHGADNYTSKLEEFTNQTSDKFKKILFGNSFRFGVMQKLMNVYLKYLWCANLIDFTPPHCPVDGIILKELKSNSLWTTQKFGKEEYEKEIEKIRNETKKNLSQFKNIAEWELIIFNGK